MCAKTCVIELQT